MGQQKMTLLQPELAKIQAKYPNSKTNTAQKQRLSQETSAFYKKNKINFFFIEMQINVLKVFEK